MNRLFIILFCFCFSFSLELKALDCGSLDYCVLDNPFGYHISGTPYIEAAVVVEAASNKLWMDNLVITAGYELSCDKGDEPYQHSKTSPNFSSITYVSGFFEISNETDGPSRINGYSMDKAWAYLQKNPSLAVVCNLKYQTQAAFSGSAITYTIGSSIFPVSVSYSTGAQVTYSSIKSERVLMKGEDYVVNDGGGGGAPCIAHCTPLIIDLGRDGIHLGEADVGVEFDLLATGQPLTLQWVKENGNEAFIGLDTNGNGVIDNGAEMFGSGTPLSETQDNGEPLKAPNGFVALAQYDAPSLGGNDDGYISPADSIWPDLVLWLDSNADGISSPDEMSKLATSEMDKIEIIPKQNYRQDSAGNLIPMWSWAVGQFNTKKFRVVDVYFKVL